ncbi:hypothetical protein [Enterobacter hormaechei]|uniref:hypothetical protein n=1 Tax=Enterobacter hormaechei TaxID=158836 RepID=UPI003AAB8069|nr:hypothetical protein [Enterobacter hormaechei]HCJ7622850.1 hypothetical protein [Enterobacter hormaechei subsp. xiangfangensis]
MSTLTKEWLLKTIAELEEERDATPGAVNEDAAKALAALKLALASLEADGDSEPVAFINGAWKLAYYRPPKELGLKIGDKLYAAQPAPVSVPDDVLKGLLPDAEKAEFWFEHNGKILFEGVKFNNAVFDACRAAMLQGAEQTKYRAIVERIAEIIHGKVTDIDLLTVTVKSMKDKLQK